MNENLKKEILARKFEKTDDGQLYMPGAKVFVGGVFANWVNDDIEDKQYSGNIVVNEGLDYFLNTGIANQTQEANWYIGVFQNNYTPQATDTGADFAGGAKGNEAGATEFDEANRPAYTLPGATSTQSLTNTASPATFTVSAAQTPTIYGAFLISTNIFGDTTGTLCAASQFAASRALIASDVLNVTYELQIADA